MREENILIIASTKKLFPILVPIEAIMKELLINP